MSGVSATRSDQPVATLSGRWLLLGRAVWCAVALLSLTFFISQTVERATTVDLFWFVNNLAPGEVSGTVPKQVIHDGLSSVGLSPGGHAALGLGLVIVRATAYYLMAALLFWRKATDRMALLVAIFLVALPSGDTDPRVLHALMDTEPLLAVTGLVPEIVAFTLLLWLFLLFPDGRFAPRWARWVALLWLLTGTGTLAMPGSALDMLAWPELLSASFFPAVAALGIGIQIWRYRSISSTVERQQTKWFVVGFAIVLIEFSAANVLTSYASITWPAVSPQRMVLADLLLHTLHNLAFMAIPLALGIAVLRHRLWDFDRLISRAVLYASLTAILAALYLGGVVTLERVFRAALGQGSDLAIIVTTLAVATAIQPLRRRLQTVIDRRFSRRKYDAARTLAAYADTLREQTNTHTVQAGLLRVVDDTMQPAHVSLWLRSEIPATERLH